MGLTAVVRRPDPSSSCVEAAATPRPAPDYASSLPILKIFVPQSGHVP